MTRQIAADRCSLCSEPAITNLDGDNLCQAHANAWCRGEAEWEAYQRECEAAETPNPDEVSQ
jgi:hypothetical protein